MNRKIASARVQMTLLTEATKHKSTVSKALPVLKQRAAELGFAISREESEESDEGCRLMWVAGKMFPTRDEAKHAAADLLRSFEEAIDQLDIRDCVHMENVSATLYELHEIRRAWDAVASCFR